MSSYSAKPAGAIRRDLGHRLRAQRISQGLRQKDLARLAGIGEATVRRIEDGGTDPRLSVLIKLLRALDLLDGLNRLVPSLTDSPLIDSGDLPERVRKPASTAAGWHWDDDDRVQLWNTDIGEVAWDSERRFADFRYLDGFLANPIEPSPLKLAKRPGIYRFEHLPEEAFQGLPGLLADALPDRYGHAVINRWLEAHGRPADSLNPVEKLLYIGTRTMGALSFAPGSRPPASTGETIEIGDLVELANEVLDTRARARRTLLKKANYEDLISVGISAGGARAKALVALNEARSELRSGQIDAPPGFTHWLLKLDGVRNSGDHGIPDPQGYGKIEYAYSLMARAAGINLPETDLLEDGPRHHFLIRRFDRPEGKQRLHVQTLGALTHVDYNKPGLFSYEQTLAVIRQLKCAAADQEALLRRAIFNVLARNQDDHVKQISFLMDKQGHWRLSPAYDITYAYNPKGRWTSRHQMSLAGKLDDFSIEDLQTLGEAAEQTRKRVIEIIEQVSAAVSRWPEFAKTAGIDGKTIRQVGGAHRRELFR